MIPCKTKFHGLATGPHTRSVFWRGFLVGQSFTQNIIKLIKIECKRLSDFSSSVVHENNFFKKKNGEICLQIAGLQPKVIKYGD